MLDLELGELHRAADTFRAVIQKSALPSGRIQPVGVVACLGLASLEYEWNDLDAAEAYARQAADLGARWGNPDTLANTHLLQSRIRRARGDTDGALESLRQAEELARGPGVTPWSALRIDAFRVRMWLAQGQLGAAEQWARQNALDAGDEISYPRQYAYLSLARILAAQGQTSTALALTRRLLEQLEALGQAARALELLLFQAMTLEEAGEPTAAVAAAPAAAPALAVLARALGLGEPEGYLRIFLDEGAPIANLLRRAASRGIAPRYAARLLASFSESGVAPAPSRQPLIEPLTVRELEILRLIADGLTNQEIARRLVLAVGTVKTHTASLYRKLDVSSRTQAVARAGDLKLL
jgi:LuxR family maltose regulon positive regulatory protein